MEENARMQAVEGHCLFRFGRAHTALGDHWRISGTKTQDHQATGAPDAP